MAVNWSDTLRASEVRAARDVFSRLSHEVGLSSAIGKVGNVLNVTGENLNPDALGDALLRLDTVKISEGVLR